MLRPEELAELESSLLPALERHHLRLLAHGLRTLQTIAQRRAGPLPERAAIEVWAQNQPVIAEDPDFGHAFIEQLVGAGSQLRDIGLGVSVDPLALELEDLISWARHQADSRLRPPAPGASPPPG